MSVEKVHSAITHYAATRRQVTGDADHDAYRKALADAEVGQQVTLRIVSQLSDQRFVAAFGGNRYVVDSMVPLAVGQAVKATVSAVGGVVELKYLGAGQFESTSELPVDQEFGEGPGGLALQALTQRYRVTLSGDEQQWIESLSDGQQEPESMALGALYMMKVGATLDEKAAQALYAQVAWNDSGNRNLLAQDVSTLIAKVQAGDRTALDSLSDSLAQAIDQSSVPASGLGGATGFAANNASTSNEQRDLNSEQRSLYEVALRLLNTQDSGALAYTYGSLPVMIGGQLVELDLLMFRERENARGGAAAGLRKLVMTLRTETLGRVEIVAQSINAKLSVAISTQSAESAELLSVHAREVRELVSRLGWNVDSVSYRLASEPARAAEQLVRHVLASGSLDAML